MAGRYVVLAFLGTASHTAVVDALAAVDARAGQFDDQRACFFGVSLDPNDFAAGRLRDSPGIRFFDDRAQEVSRLYGALDAAGTFRGYALLLDPGLRVIEAVPLSAIAALSAAWRTGEQRESGFMREVGGRTVEVRDAAFKQRQDHTLADEELIAGARDRVLRRVAPEIAKAFQFKATRMERYLVARYGAGEGHFRAHRDNTTKGTAHRRFAVSINLCAEAHEGGELRFAEFGPRSYKPATGAAVVFGCGLLHEVTAVTAGERFAFLPFLHDDEAAKLRAENAQFIGTS